MRLTCQWIRPWDRDIPAIGVGTAHDQYTVSCHGSLLAHVRPRPWGTNAQQLALPECFPAHLALRVLWKAAGGSSGRQSLFPSKLTNAEKKLHGKCSYLLVVSHYQICCQPHIDAACLHPHGSANIFFGDKETDAQVKTSLVLECWNDAGPNGITLFAVRFCDRAYHTRPWQSDIPFLFQFIPILWRHIIFSRGRHKSLSNLTFRSSYWTTIRKCLNLELFHRI